MLAAPGPGPNPLSLSTPGFYVLVATLVLFVAMLFVLRTYYPNRKRGLEGYLEAAGVSLGFLVVSVVVVVAIALHDPDGNRTSYALFEAIISGYWLAVAIPVVTVGSSVQARSRGTIRWLLPSMIVAAVVFLGVFAYCSAA